MNTKTMTHKPTVLVRIAKTFNANHLKQIRDSVSVQSGVLDIQPSERLPNLMLVEYDALRISSLKILQTVRNEDRNAFLIAI